MLATRRKQHRNKTLKGRFCRCIKAVASQQQKPGAESRAIAICVKSVIQRKKGRTLHSFRCKNTKQPSFIKTQKQR